MSDKRVSDMTDDEIRQLAGATESPAASDERDLLQRAAAALMDCAKSVLAVKPSLDQPYPDHPGWTPYTRWVERPAEQAVGIAGEIREHLRTLKSHRETPAGTLRRIADEDIGGNCPWLADELHELARAVELDMSGPASPIPRRWSFTRDDLTDVISHLEASVPVTGPAAGKIDADSMAAAIIEGLERRQREGE